MKKKPFTIALCYDFDGTLSPGNMQEYAFIPSLQKSPSAFWKQSRKLAREHGADEILAYMFHMCESARQKRIKITKEDFESFGKSVEFFPGVLPSKGADGWFERVNAHSKKFGAEVRHYIISSGIREMIDGTPIAGKFDRIYASSFVYDIYGAACWPAMAVNYTTKMQFLFRINKGVFDIHESVNDYMPEEERPVPFSRMIYFGDGSTDIPAMKLVKTQNGYSIAVHDGSPKKKVSAEKLLSFSRVNYVAEADYRPESDLARQVARVIEKICAERAVETATDLA